TGTPLQSLIDALHLAREMGNIDLIRYYFRRREGEMEGKRDVLRSLLGWSPVGPRKGGLPLPARALEDLSIASLRDLRWLAGQFDDIELGIAIEKQIKAAWGA